MKILELLQQVLRIFKGEKGYYKFLHTKENPTIFKLYTNEDWVEYTGRSTGDLVNEIRSGSENVCKIVGEGGIKMKTTELIERVKQLGLETDYFNHEIYINDKEGQTICSIVRNRRFQLDIDYYAVKDELLRIVVEYSSTPVDER